MLNPDNQQKITNKAEELGITSEEVESRIPFLTKLFGTINPKIIGGFVKRMTAENNTQKVLTKQLSDDLEGNKGKYETVMQKLAENPGLLDQVNKALGTNLTLESLGYDKANNSLNSDTFLAAAGNMPINSEEFAAKVESLHANLDLSQLDLIGQPAESASAAASVDG